MSNSPQDALICPITYEIFRNPVVAEDGHTYEKEAIVDWINKDGTSPITRERLTVDGLRPNYTVKKLVDEFEKSLQKKNYQFRLGVDVKKSRKALFQTFGKSIFEAEWLTKDNKGPRIVLMKIDGARAKKEASFYVDLSRHPHIVRTFGLVDDNFQDNNNKPTNSVMLLQEYAPEGSLYELLQELNTVPNEQILLQMFIQTTDAMVFLVHNGIIHGDLACRNILVFRFDEQEPRQNLVKITDFGLSRHSSIYATANSVARTTLNIVPTRYAAPEILNNNGKSSSYTEKSDVYSMGITMWEAYSKGTIPWSQIDNDEEVRRMVVNGEILSQPANCQDEKWKIITTSLSKKPEDQITTIPCELCGELIEFNEFQAHMQPCAEMEKRRLQRKAPYVIQDET
ncbi:unnamed protein product [Didymodactylos carnosus]|uniref:Non-specific serine/threonine protein kinase n=1 Tax=Didymodactylos carnosus TaxID=1234261 RepID=A0A815CAI4_9BILA|nr:unnamed protein product [Didymodactylos carnosus]CAF1281082.1 unnamed protein product [Didymodactylos carnosus]CAF3806766.1 unnamed protein product [Didymodactylos carnosus]CAF4076433.1 unnamed protein product [Didymodactylos carnosus]